MDNTVKKKAKRLKRRWSLYPDNIPLPAANLLIVRCTQDGTTQLTTRYEVEYLCCGRKEILNHQSIRYRASKNRRLCRFCVYKHNSELRRGGRRPAYDAPYGVVAPEWPVPPTSQTLRFECGNCRHWEEIYSGVGMGDHLPGRCSWLISVTTPMWLTTPDALLLPETLAGAGQDCLAWGGKQ